MTADHGRRDGDDSPVVFRRWIIILVITSAVHIGVAGCNYWSGTEIRAVVADYPVLKRDVNQIQKVIEMYEGPNGLRVQRAQEIARLQEQVSELTRKQDDMRKEMNDKLDRLLLGQRRGESR